MGSPGVLYSLEPVRGALTPAQPALCGMARLTGGPISSRSPVPVSAHQLPSHRMPSLPHANSAWPTPPDPTRPRSSRPGTEDHPCPVPHGLRPGRTRSPRRRPAALPARPRVSGQPRSGAGCGIKAAIGPPPRFLCCASFAGCGLSVLSGGVAFVLQPSERRYPGCCGRTVPGEPRGCRAPGGWRCSAPGGAASRSLLLRAVCGMASGVSGRGSQRGEGGQDRWVGRGSAASSWEGIECPSPCLGSRHRCVCGSSLPSGCSERMRACRPLLRWLYHQLLKLSLSEVY